MDGQSQLKQLTITEYKEATRDPARSSALIQAEPTDDEDENLSITFNAKGRSSANTQAASPRKRLKTRGSASYGQQASGSLRIRPQTAASIQVLLSAPVAEGRCSRHVARRQTYGQGRRATQTLTKPTDGAGSLSLGTATIARSFRPQPTHAAQSQLRRKRGLKNVSVPIGKEELARHRNAFLAWQMASTEQSDKHVLLDTSARRDEKVYYARKSQVDFAQDRTAQRQQSSSSDFRGSRP